MLTTNLTGNFGNNMWQYSVCRAVATKLGYEWGMNMNPTHDYYNGQNQMYFMNVDFGSNISNIKNQYHEKWLTYKHVDEVNITFFDPKIYEIEDNTRLLGDNGAISGIFQSEDYLFEQKADIINWFKFKKEYVEKYEQILKNLSIILNDDTCVINFRGGEYRTIPNVIVRKEYWKDAIQHMLKLNPKMKFVIISDDPTCAKSFMPFDIPVHHVEIGFDFYVVNKAKWNIISNSSFGWWATWLNTRTNKIIAPKYWARHNVSDGYWSTGDSYTRCFSYLDREGNMFDYESCKQEAIDYYSTKKLIDLRK